MRIPVIPLYQHNDFLELDNKASYGLCSSRAESCQINEKSKRKTTKFIVTLKNTAEEPKKSTIQIIADTHKKRQTILKAFNVLHGSTNDLDEIKKEEPVCGATNHPKDSCCGKDLSSMMKNQKLRSTCDSQLQTDVIETTTQAISPMSSTIKHYQLAVPCKYLLNRKATLAKYKEQNRQLNNESQRNSTETMCSKAKKKKTQKAKKLNERSDCSAQLETTTTQTPMSLELDRRSSDVKRCHSAHQPSWATDMRLDFLEHQLREIRRDVSGIQREIVSMAPSRFTILQQRIEDLTAVLTKVATTKCLQKSSSLTIRSKERIEQLHYYSQPPAATTNVTASTCTCSIEEKEHVCPLHPPEEKKIETVQTETALVEEQPRPDYDAASPVETKESKSKTKRKSLGTISNIMLVSSSSLVLKCLTTSKKRKNVIQLSSSSEDEVEEKVETKDENKEIVKPVEENNEKPYGENTEPQTEKVTTDIIYQCKECCPENRNVSKSNQLRSDVGSFCRLCGSESTVRIITANLDDEVRKMINPYQPNEVALTVLLEQNNLYHINIAIMANGKSLGCLYATEESLNIAIADGMFEKFLTFFIMDANNTQEEKSKIFSYTFELIK